jgi:hypothetical protein
MNQSTITKALIAIIDTHAGRYNTTSGATDSDRVEAHPSAITVFLHKSAGRNPVDARLTDSNAKRIVRLEGY